MAGIYNTARKEASGHLDEQLGDVGRKERGEEVRKALFWNNVSPDIFSKHLSKSFPDIIR